MSAYDDERRRIEAAFVAVDRHLREEVLAGRRLCIVRAPPGSGKTHLLTQVAASVARPPGQLRVAIACQTNSQTDDVCKRLSPLVGPVPLVRFASSSGIPTTLPDNVLWVTKTADLPHGPCVVVGTSAKWGLVDLSDSFDVLFVDEAWQLAFKDFQILTQVAPSFVFIGDPGQIPPVVTVPIHRWATLAQAPHRPAPEVMGEMPEVDPALLQLPATRRLPYDSARMVRSFYDFDFASLAGPGQRAILTPAVPADAIGAALHRLSDVSVCALTLPTPDSGPPLEVDHDVARTAVAMVVRALGQVARYRDGQVEHPITPERIGIAATHRKMVTAIELVLPADLRGLVRVDTPERWQGLECELMIAVHPLSGVSQPSQFDLETGRLCVMASRHRGGLIVVARDHVPSTLERTVPSASQPVGVPDITGKGHWQHSSFWRTLSQSRSVVAMP